MSVSSVDVSSLVSGVVDASSSSVPVVPGVSAVSGVSGGSVPGVSSSVVAVAGGGVLSVGEGYWVRAGDVAVVEGERDAALGELEVARGEVESARARERRTVESAGDEVRQLRERLVAAEGRERVAVETVGRLRAEDADRNAAAREWADENSLCSQFERFCEAYGWVGRVTEYEVTVRVTADVTVSVEGARDLDSSDLGDLIDDDEVRSMVRAGNYDVVSREVYDYSS